ncbi:hypothetical protein DPMN_129335 [Dreissena polymorpha]|uniref:Uncharacterized protein n=1 Tax=Dreissena polymorpha TaxID=45954 RepID=A0A9D4H4P8_DREPO|nr:hypothetical protein DPMN_129335 [Dreissena polymorpha]
MQQAAVMSMPGFRQQGLPQQGRQFSSANSAFSPVSQPPGEQTLIQYRRNTYPV